MSKIVAKDTIHGGQPLAIALSGSGSDNKFQQQAATVPSYSAVPLIRSQTRAAFQINIKPSSALASNSSLKAQSLFDLSLTLCGSVGRICALFAVSAASINSLLIA